MLEVGVSEELAQRVWLQVDMWLKKVVAVWRRRQGNKCISWFAHNCYCLVGFTCNFLLPSLTKTIG
jgi:hypothetical protein